MAAKNDIAKFETGKFYKLRFSSFGGKTPVYRIVRLVGRKRNRLHFEGYWECCGVVYKYALERTAWSGNGKSEGCRVGRKFPLLPVTYADEALCKKPKWWDSCRREVGR